MSFFSNRFTGFILPFLFLFLIPLKKTVAQHETPEEERQFLVESLLRIADPVLTHLSEEKLKENMPVETLGGRDRADYTHLEAFGRLLAGMAPWLELGADGSKEGKQREKYIRLAQRGLKHATNPQSPDFMNFNSGSQPLVDAAFLAHALLRAPQQLWKPLDEQTKDHIVKALQSSRIINPPANNWLFFSAMIEAALLKFTGSCEMDPIKKAVDRHMEWYVGDGVYGDGPHFHWDYYNSYVIQPMFLDVLKVLLETGHSGYQKTYEQVLKRAKRYAYVQLSLISPEGTYPPLGRSLAYRFGAFQLLSQMALEEQLPKELKPQEVRAALYTVIKRQISIPGTFDSKGWLQIGMAGHQPKVGENYISTGSLYLCSTAFLFLGLTKNSDLWTGADEDWISRRIWKGEDFPIQHAID